MNIAKRVREYVDKCKEREPIFINNVIVSKEYKNARSVAFYKLRLSNKIKFYKNGIYYKPKFTSFGELGIDTQSLIKKLYIEDDSYINGYLTGPALWNNWGITTQVPVRTWIVTNSVNKNKEIAEPRVKLLKPKVIITNENYKVLQLLDMIDQVEQIQDINYDFYIKILKNKIRIMDEYTINLTINLAKYYNKYVYTQIESLLRLRRNEML